MFRLLTVASLVFAATAAAAENQQAQWMRAFLLDPLQSLSETQPAADGEVYQVLTFRQGETTVQYLAWEEQFQFYCALRVRVGNDPLRSASYNDTDCDNEVDTYGLLGISQATGQLAWNQPYPYRATANEQRSYDQLLPELTQVTERIRSLVTPKLRRLTAANLVNQPPAQRLADMAAMRAHDRNGFTITVESALTADPTFGYRFDGATATFYLSTCHASNYAPSGLWQTEYAYDARTGALEAVRHGQVLADHRRDASPEQLRPRPPRCGDAAAYLPWLEPTRAQEGEAALVLSTTLTLADLLAAAVRTGEG